MLTKNDRKQLITDFKEVFVTKDDLQSLATKDDLKKELRPIKKDIRQIQKDINSALAYTDEEIKPLKNRVKRVESHLGFPPTS